MSTNGLVVLQVPSRLTWEDWCARVKNVATMKKKLYFYIGDLILYGEQVWHEKASQMLNDFGYSAEQLASFKSVAKKFPPEERCDLPWTYHQAAASLPKRERDKALSAALAGEMNRADIRALANGNGHVQQVAGPANPLIDALLLVGKLLSRENKGEDVSEVLGPALDELISESMAKLARISRKSKAEG
jgi:hypothetical protein